MQALLQGYSGQGLQWFVQEKAVRYGGDGWVSSSGAGQCVCNCEHSVRQALMVNNHTTGKGHHGIDHLHNDVTVSRDILR